MCIICNCGDTGNDFLTHYEDARRAIRLATEAMLACSKIDRNYDAAHKQLVRMGKEWNKLEHTREHPETMKGNK